MRTVRSQRSQPPLVSPSPPHPFLNSHSTAHSEELCTPGTFAYARSSVCTPYECPAGYYAAGRYSNYGAMTPFDCFAPPLAASASVDFCSAIEIRFPANADANREFGRSRSSCYQESTI